MNGPDNPGVMCAHRPHHPPVCLLLPRDSACHKHREPASYLRKGRFRAQASDSSQASLGEGHPSATSFSRPGGLHPMPTPAGCFPGTGPGSASRACQSRSQTSFSSLLPRLLNTAVSCREEHNAACPKGPTLGKRQPQPSWREVLCDPGQVPCPLWAWFSFMRSEGARQGQGKSLFNNSSSKLSLSTKYRSGKPMAS
jgi:hypothetical protein